MDRAEHIKWKKALAGTRIYPLIHRDFDQGRIMLHSTPAGSCISHAADEGYHIIYLLEGSIKVWTLSCRGRRVLLDEVRPMAFSGHISRLRGHSFDSNLVANADCVYLSFTDEQFRQLMQEPSFALEFYRSTSQRAYYMFHKFLGLSLFTAEENTAMYCLSHPERLSAYTLEQMSEEIGISRRSLCYVVKRWQEQGVVLRQDGGYTIAAPEALERLARDIRAFYEG